MAAGACTSLIGHVDFVQSYAITGNTTVKVFSVKSCCRERMTIKADRVAEIFDAQILLDASAGFPIPGPGNSILGGDLPAFRG